ncbi:MBL fold metallo-hydrolase [Pseudomonas proteolytica]|uniref:MBL fold metallo-hydrolase n=1 Tax=Pseudomonas proteolytica TaxID=219574 RepID=UPI0030EC4CFD
MAINFQPPAVAELEVSLFGPGTGECIVAHLGENEWMVVDSCTVENKVPVALDYLTKLGVSADRVKLIVITHFHDDHIAGASALIEACTSAEVFISGALTHEESISYSLAHALDDVLVDKAKPSTYEIAKIIRSVEVGDRHIEFVGANQVLYRKNNVLVHSLSPSSRAIAQSRLLFADRLLKVETDFRKLANKLHPNLCAIALHICNGVDTVLLGSDLEVSNDPALGWEAVVLNAKKPITTAALFKVPHHGSQNGHSEDVVNSMLREKPISILTTFDRSSLPREEDILRIKSYSDSLYFTSLPKVRAPVRSRAVEENILLVVKSRRVVTKDMGHIQVRMLNGVSTVLLNTHASAAA